MGSGRVYGGSSLRLCFFLRVTHHLRRPLYNHDDVISDIVGDYQLAGLSARCIQNDPITTIFYPEPSPKKLEKVLDALGREVNHTTNQILFYIYDDGSVEKKFIVE